MAAGADSMAAPPSMRLRFRVGVNLQPASTVPDGDSSGGPPESNHDTLRKLALQLPRSPNFLFSKSPHGYCAHCQAWTD